MLLDALVVAGASFRRQLRPSAVLLAVGLGATLGLLARALPDDAPWSPERWQAPLLGVALVALLAGGASGAARRRRLAPRPLASLAWSSGELFGGAVAAGVLLMVALAGVRAAQFGDVAPRELLGRAEGGERAWRFELPAGSTGPFPLEFEADLPFTLAGRVRWVVERGAQRAEGDTPVDSAGRVRVLLPDLSPARGNLVLRLRAREGLVLGDAAPRLLLDAEPRALPTPWISRAARRTLLLASLVTLAAGCAFSRRTSALAGLIGLALHTPADPTPFVLAMLLLFGFAWAATSLRRRTLTA